jgi:hypothetical protein
VDDEIQADVFGCVVVFLFVKGNGLAQLGADSDSQSSLTHSHHIHSPGGKSQRPAPNRRIASLTTAATTGTDTLLLHFIIPIIIIVDQTVCA